jgi:hypothetical protein
MDGYLHRNPRIHVVCGATFGWDFVLYNGWQEERHSFVGLHAYGSGRHSSKDKVVVSTQATQARKEMLCNFPRHWHTT